MDHEKAVEYLLERQLGRIDEESAAELDAHLAQCDRCRRATEVFDTLRAALDDEREHPAPDEIAAYVTDRDGLLPRERERIEGHLGRCGSCSDEVSKATRVEASVTGGDATEGDGTIGDRTSGVRVRTVWALAAAILVTAMIYPAYLGMFRLPGVIRAARDLGIETQRLESTVDELESAFRSASSERDRLRTWTGAIGLQQLRSGRRGEDREQEVRVDPAQPFVVLAVQVVIPRDARVSGTLRFEIVSKERRSPDPIDVSVGEARRQMTETGVVTLVVPTVSLESGGYRLRVTLPDQPDRDAVLEIGLRVRAVGT